MALFLYVVISLYVGPTVTSCLGVHHSSLIISYVSYLALTASHLLSLSTLRSSAIKLVSEPVSGWSYGATTNSPADTSISTFPPPRWVFKG